jgi:hypothetical protein
MANRIVSPEIVKRIAEIEEQWNAAARLIREALKGWAKRSATAGIEKGAYRELGKVCESIAPALGLDMDAVDYVSLGQAAFAAYRAGRIVDSVPSHTPRG